MWQRFTEQARETVVYAQEAAAKMGTYNVDTEHLLLGLLRQQQGGAVRLLQHIGVEACIVRNATLQQGMHRQSELWATAGKVWPPPPKMEGYTDQEPTGAVSSTPPEIKSAQNMELTRPGKHVIDFAYDEARKLNNGNIGPEHLLLGMIREGKGIAAQVLAAHGIELDRTRQAARVMQSTMNTKITSNWLKTLFGMK